VSKADPIPNADLEAERIILGAIVVEPVALTSAMVQLKPAHFCSSAHRTIYSAMVALADQGVGVDLVTLKEQLRASGELESVGGLPYIMGLMDGIPRLANLDEWCAIVRDKALVRQVGQAAVRLMALCSEDGVSGTQAAEGGLREMIAASDSGISSQGFKTPKEDLDEALRRIDEMATSSNGITGLATGLADLDDTLGGLKPGDLVIVGGRPAMGKTALGIHVGEHVARSMGRPVAYFSMEMTRAEITMRRIMSEARVSSLDIRGLGGASKGMARISTVGAGFATRPFVTDDTFGVNIGQMRAKLQRLKVIYPDLALVVVDHLQLVQGYGEENRNQEVSAISRGLKGMAKDFGITVLALSQLSRVSDKRADKRPQLCDLRDSGGIEQDADVVLLLHRAEEYEPENAEARGAAEINVAKHRNGPTRMIRVAFVKEFTRFENAARDWQVVAA
jgi:replicative DNA helicase